MTGAGKRQAWASFWREDQGRNGGCLAGAAGELGHIQKTMWEGFAAMLPKGGRVLDLGTGDGIVLKQLAGARRDLRLTGVDSAPALPRPSGKLRLMADVAMEQLPFPDSRFEAVVSQFGYEYGDTAAVAREAARVLVPGGRYAFLVHHREGPVVAHNAGRADALRWAVVDSGILDRARALAKARTALALPTPPAFRDAIGDAARLFPGQPVAAEIAQAALQALSLQPHHSLAMLDEIGSKGAGELVRLEALAGAARDESGAQVLVEQLREAGLQADPAKPVLNRAGRPFAWRLEGHR